MLHQGESQEAGLLTLRRPKHTFAWELPNRYQRERLGFVGQFGLFDGHVFEFAGFEDVAAFQALNEFGVLFAGHDLHTRVLAFWHVTSLLGELGLRDWIHKSGLFPGPSGPGMSFAGICAVL